MVKFYSTQEGTYVRTMLFGSLEPHQAAERIFRFRYRVRSSRPPFFVKLSALLLSLSFHNISFLSLKEVCPVKSITFLRQQPDKHRWARWVHIAGRLVTKYAGWFHKNYVRLSPQKSSFFFSEKRSTATRFELARAEPSRFRIYLLNHSDTLPEPERRRVRVVKEVD